MKTPSSAWKLKGQKVVEATEILTLHQIRKREAASKKRPMISASEANELIRQARASKPLHR
jgi:hypothetical protein